MSKIKLAILFGGKSPEHEVSCASAASVIENLDKEKYEIYKVGITKAGKWMLTQASNEQIKDRQWEELKSNIEAVISPDATDKSLLIIKSNIVEKVSLNCIFPVIHGRNCEDGVMQGLLELSGIPYVGAGVTASACSMDKAITKLIIDEEGIKQADYILITKDELEEEEIALKKVEEHFKKYPLFIKPANEGSSVGISKVNNREELKKGLLDAAFYDRKILVEEAIQGREIEVAVLGNSKPEAAKIGEILSCNEFYDYEAKYIQKESKTKILDNISQETEKEIKENAIRAFKAMGCKGMARVDFFLTENDEIVLNEINTLPGFTQISMYPKMWQASGMSYAKLLDTLIELAMED